MDVIAEGIETDAQRLKLKSFRCKHGQGYLFAPQAPAQSVETLLHHQNELCGPPVKSEDEAVSMFQVDLQECTEYLT